MFKVGNSSIDVIAHHHIANLPGNSYLLDDTGKAFQEAGCMF